MRELRQQNGESLRSAARSLGVDPSYLSRIERDAQPVSTSLREKAANYYDADPVRLALARGDVPEDIVEILVQHPELLDELRQRYG